MDSKIKEIGKYRVYRCTSGKETWFEIREGRKSVVSVHATATAALNDALERSKPKPPPAAPPAGGG